MRFTPKPHQHTAISFMLDAQRCNLWAEMGMGKTSATLAVLSMMKVLGSNYFPVLVLAPKRVAESVWPKEIEKWDDFQHLTCSVVLGPAYEREAALKRKADIYTINYENLLWLVETLDGEWPFMTVVADEATALKGFRLRHGGKRAAALSKVARRTGRWINLTGTPSPNGLLDLWGQNWFVDYGARLGKSFTAFKERWFDENVYERTIKPRPAAIREIPAALRDVTLALRTEDWFDLDVPVETDVEIDLPPRARRLYDEMERDLFFELGGDLSIEALNGAARSGKCLQIAAGAVWDNEEEKAWHPLHTAKIDALRSVMEEAAGAPLLVAYHFRFDRERLLKAFPQARSLTYDHDIDDWNAGKIPMLLVHPASAGHGLNLQDGGNHIVFYSQGWALEHRLQVIERIGPMRQRQSGHNRPVYITNIVARDTIEQTVLRPAMRDKKAVQDTVMKGNSRSE